MILLLDTSSGLCRLTLVDGERWYEYDWHADRTLARELLAYLRDKLAGHGKTFDAIQGIGVMKGPGSFTGLRIGMTVLNTLANDRHAPIVGTRGESWREHAVERLSAKEDDHLVMPEYGSEATITTPRK